jgi:hypothetical protein
MNDTLVLLTFDEDETYTDGNKIYSILLGGAIPENLRGTTDDTFYNHVCGYSASHRSVYLTAATVLDHLLSLRQLGSPVSRPLGL